jgi:hypothetical protein
MSDVVIISGLPQEKRQKREISWERTGRPFVIYIRRDRVCVTACAAGSSRASRPYLPYLSFPGDVKISKRNYLFLACKKAAKGGRKIARMILSIVINRILSAI